MAKFWYKVFTSCARHNLLNWVPDDAYLKIMYRGRTGKKLNLDKPITFNEKLQWLKLHDRKPAYTTMVDKYAVKQYIAEKIGLEYIVPNVVEKTWNSFDEIDFSELPNQFVLKCTHDSGGLVICQDKEQLNHEMVRTKIEKAMKAQFYFLCREWPYKNVKPRIFAETYLSNGTDELIDYKFYCFNGQPQFLYISKGLSDHATASIDFVTLDWEKAPFYRDDYKRFEELPEKPQKFNEMLDIAAKLSEGIPFVRVDLYEIEGQVKFSELTFSPCGGFMHFCPEGWDEKIGKLLDLNVLNNTK